MQLHWKYRQPVNKSHRKQCRYGWLTEWEKVYKGDKGLICEKQDTHPNIKINKDKLPKTYSKHKVYCENLEASSF